MSEWDGTFINVMIVVSSLFLAVVLGGVAVVVYADAQSRLASCERID